MRGDVYELPAHRGTQGHEQRGRRYAVVVQSSLLPLSTWVVCPTSNRAQPSSFRPVIELHGTETRVMVDQMTAVDSQRLGNQVARLSLRDMQEVDRALALVLDLRLHP